MEQNKPSSNKLREKLNSLPNTQWDTDALWADLEQQLPQPKQRGILWVFLMFAVGLSLFLYVFALNQPAVPSESLRMPQAFAEAQKQPVDITPPNSTKTPNSKESTLENDHWRFSPAFAKNQTIDRIWEVTPPLPSPHHITQVRPLMQSPTIDRFPIHPLPTKRSSAVHSPKPGTTKPIKPIQPVSQGYWTLNLRTSVCLPVSSFGPVANEPLNYAGRNRKSTETPLEIVETQFTASYYLSPRWQISSGFRFSQWTTRLDWRSTQQSIIRVHSDRAFFYVAKDGRRQYFSGSVPTQQTESRVIQHYNTLQQIDLPFRITYRRQSNPWGWYVEGGLAINLARQVTGRYIDAQNTPQPIALFDGFRHPLGTSLLGGFGVSWAWHPNWSLNAGLQMEYRPASLVDPEITGYQQHLHQIGLGFGLTRKL